jgi:hypothetical protein
MSELAEVCLDGEVSQTCPPDFPKWLQLKLWILDDKTIWSFSERSPGRWIHVPLPFFEWSLVLGFRVWPDMSGGSGGPFILAISRF